MIEAQVEFDEHVMYLNGWTIEIHFWDKNFQCLKSYCDSKWFDSLEEAIKYCMEN